MRSLHELLPSEQAKQGDRILKEADELLERRKGVADIDNYNMARGLLTSAMDFRYGIEKKSVIRRSQQSRLYLDKAHETLQTIKQVTLERMIKIQREEDVEHPLLVSTEYEHATTGYIDGIEVGPLRVVVDHTSPRPSSGLPSPFDNQPSQVTASYMIHPVSRGTIKEEWKSDDVAPAASSLPTPPLTPESPAKISPARPIFSASTKR
ncbi:hypothetical protein B0F90DRAFT_1747326 [Multifurca ochricompacta]|uniref:Uncharacterized protein n=1 Tax=Multifurca ochricompacta TaxID=376703 RepID=A0AAD4LZX7_9AGAM|nr:hypothetical protein B0F90DRAFT_1747326 [Multifurca ochricompacta]